MNRYGLCLAIACVCVAGFISCTRAAEPFRADDNQSSLRQVSLPDLSSADVSVQEQLRESDASLGAKLRDASASAADRGEAYGALAMLLDAAEYFDAAELYYVNAQTLLPNDPRWPYYLGHIYRQIGQPERAVTAFRRVLDSRSGDVPALVWLARLYIAKGEPEQAEPLLTRALSVAPRSVPVLAALGQVALARKDYANAVTRLEEALAANPRAATLHSPLAMAYRGLGRLEEAERHLNLWRDEEISVPDPLMAELQALLDSGLSYQSRGVEALQARNFPAAAALFRKGLVAAAENTPLRRSLHQRLGTALFLVGDEAGAIEQFEQTVRLAPAADLDEPASRAHYSLGIISGSRGERPAAIRHLSQAVRYDPNYVDALLRLAELLRESGRFREALLRYDQVVRIDPRVIEARIEHARILVAQKRHSEARLRLREAMAVNPGNAELAAALADIDR